MTFSQNSTNGARRPSVVPSASSVSDAHDLALAIQLVRQLREGIEQSGPGHSAADESLTEQLHTLYADREQLESQLGTAEPARIFERIRNLEGQLESVKSSLASLGQHLGNGDLVEFVVQTESTIKSLTEQLHAFYQEREGNADAGSESATVASLVEQLHSFYAEREGNADAGSESATVASLVEQLHALYAEREGKAQPIDETSALASLVEQLHALYAEREGAADPSLETSTVQSLVEQIHALYAERERLTHAFGSADAEDIAASVVANERSLVEQLHALYDEREELAREIGGENPLAVIRNDRTSIESLVAQLATFYSEKEGAPSNGNGHGHARSALDEVRARFFGS